VCPSVAQTPLLVGGALIGYMLIAQLTASHKVRAPMPIHRLLQNLSFNQDDIDRLAAAYEEALRALHISDRDDPINQVIAQRIIEGARTGVRDPSDLCKMAIKDLMVP
jgi:hypothetical protein